jgi:hypothetical protein
MKLAEGIEKRAAPLSSVETGKTYYRLLLSPEALQAIKSALRGA